MTRVWGRLSPFCGESVPSRFEVKESIPAPAPSNTSKKSVSEINSQLKLEAFWTITGLNRYYVKEVSLFN